MKKKVALFTALLLTVIFMAWVSIVGSHNEVTTIAGLQQGQGLVYYVALDGDDSNPGTEAQPFRTIDRSVRAAQPGDTVYVREGIYYERVRIRHSGAENNPITISAYPGERPIIDGGCEDCEPDWGDLVHITGDHIVFSGFEVKRSSGPGVEVYGAHNVIRDLKVHHNIRNGITVHGDHNLVEGCKVWWNERVNEYGQAGGWGAGLSAGRYPSYTIIRNNVVYNNWGEGLSTFEADHTTIEDNVVYDNYAVNLYIDNCPYALVQRNLVYDTDDSDFGLRRASAIGFCDEKYGSKPARSHHVTIVNNMVLGTGASHVFYVFRQHPDGGLKDCIIAYNTFVNSHEGATFQIDAGDHANSRIENNLILEESSRPIAVVPSDPELQFSHNLWSKTPPASASSPDDVIGDPQLAKSGATGPGQLTPEWFKLLALSPAQDRAKVINEVTEDFFGNARGSKPDVGAYEYPY